MKEVFCYEHHEWFDNFKKHLRETNHRCKLYKPNYNDLCTYKNCIKQKIVDNRCEVHLGL